MAFDKQSIITKIAGKGVITPYEAIYLQYLNKLHVKEQIPDVEQWKNPYIAAEKIPDVYSQYDLDRILTFQTIEESNQYDAYRWAANLMVNLDSGTAELGYKAIALLNEIRHVQSEYALVISKKMRDDIQIEGTIFEFSGYSHVHQQVMTFAQLVTSFSESFSFLLMGIDNILTLNYYLRSMVDKKEYTCLKFLSMILAEEQVEEDEKGTNIAHVCYKQIVDHIIESNHKKFIAFMQWQFQSFNLNLSKPFFEGSLEYVKESLSDIVVATASFRHGSEDIHDI